MAKASSGGRGLSPKITKKRHLAWLLTAIISAAAGTGSAIFGGVTTSMGETASKEHDRAKFDRLKTQQVVLYGVAGGLGAVAVTALILYFVTGREVPTDSASQQANIGFGVGTRGEATLQWRF